MNEEKRSGIINEASLAIISRAKLELSNVYMKAYYEGIHDLRNKYKDYLIINPLKKESLEKYSEDPCVGCINYSIHNTLGCEIQPSKCVIKQNQLLALDILKHFK